MKISSRPTHRQIRRSTLEIRQEKWKRAARRVVATSMSQLLRDGDLVIPRREENIGRIFTASANERLSKASAEAKALKFELLDEVETPAAKQKSRPPVTQPAPGTYAGRGGDPWVFSILLILAITAFMVFLGYLATR